MNYSESIDYLNGFVNFERQFEPRYGTTEADLDRFRELLRQLGNPHQQYPIIHIAGTKGKGSTGAIIAAILLAAGYRTGFYTSPHLVSVRERIRLERRIITRSEFAAAMTAIRALPDKPRLGDEVAFRTVFEHLTAAALWTYARHDIQAAVVEAGLGGKLDATVVVHPVLSVMTPIGLDHTAILGDTVELIAADKAYIIKSATPAVTSPQASSVLDILQMRARQVGARLTVAPGRAEFTQVVLSAQETCFFNDRPGLNSQKLYFKLAGEYQLENLSTALTAVDELRRRGFHIPPDAVKQGLRRVRWPGRMQMLNRYPRVLLDGAHNALGVKALTQSLNLIFPNQKWRIVFSAMRSKPTLEMISQLDELALKYYLAPICFPRGMSSEQ
ncbi:MAG: cyanophycin synthetase, partial [Calditrichota bacterium]